MAFRRLTRSLSKSLPTEHQPLETHTVIHKKNKNKKMITKTKSEPQRSMEWEELEAALNPAADFLPVCFQSQPRPAPSSQLSDAGLSFACDLLQASDAPTDVSWKFMCDEDESPGTQLEMVSGMDQILESSSLLYSPVSSVAPVASPPSPPAPATAQLSSAEELLNFYLPSPGPTPSPLSDGDSSHISDEDLLDDLDSILSSYVEPEPDQSLSHIHIGYNPPADTVELALSSQYVEGLFVYEDPSQPSPAEDVVPVPGPSGRGTGAKKAAAAPAASKRGRKRKASSDSDSAEERKRKQNAEAAKNYRKRKAEQMNKVFEEKEEVEKELERARKKVLGKLNERNILLKMLYESYKENGQSAPHKILFPAWIETWYQKQKDD